MPVLSRIAAVWLLMLPLVAVDASPFENGSSVIGSDSNWGSKDLSPNLLVDCHAYFASLSANSTVKTTSTLASNTSIPQSLVPFEEYWCDNWAWWLETDPEEDGIQHLFHGLPAGSKSACLSLEKATYSSWAATRTVAPVNPTSEAPKWSPIMSSPCCDTYCDIQASAAQLYYWPTTSPTPNITTLVGDGGFTYTFPSVYLVYREISAVGDCGVVGSTYARLTQSFAPSELLTVASVFGIGVALNPADLISNCTTRDPSQTYQLPACETQIGGSANQVGGLEGSPSCQSQLASHAFKISYEQKHCYPSIYYPTAGLHEADPAWATCIAPKWRPMFDPPRTLNPAAAMVPETTSAIRHSDTAAPASTPDPPAVSRTAPPSLPAIATGSVNDPLQQDPPSHDPPASDPPVSDPPAKDPPANDPPINNSPISDPLAKDPPQNSSPAKDSPQINSPASDPPAKDPPQINSPVDGSPAKESSVNNPAKNSPSADDPSAEGPSMNGPSGTNPPTTDPQNMSQSAQDNSKDPTKHPSPSFAIPVSGEQPLSGSVINPSSVVIAGSTIAAGASAVQLQGHQVSLNPAASNVVVDGQGHALPVPNSSPLTQVGNVPSPKLIATTVDGHNIQAASVSGVILIDGQSVTRGADRILVASTPITLQTNGDLVVAASTIHSLVPPSPNSPSVFTAAGQPATVLSNGIAIAGTTLTPNAPAISISGTPISLGTDGLVIGTSIIPVPTPAPGTLITAAGQAVTALANGNIVIAGTTLAPNAAVVTISGTPISLGTNGLIVGTSTIALPTTQAMQSITIGRQLLFMSLDTSDVVVAGTTLQLGQPAVTIAGTPVSLGTFGLVIGTSTISLPSSDSSQGIGGFIFSGFNGGPAAPSTTGVAGSTQQQINSTQNGNMVAFLGGAAKAMSRWSTFIIPTIVVCILLLT